MILSLYQELGTFGFEPFTTGQTVWDFSPKHTSTQYISVRWSKQIILKWILRNKLERWGTLQKNVPENWLYISSYDRTIMYNLKVSTPTLIQTTDGVHRIKKVIWDVPKCEFVKWILHYFQFTVGQFRGVCGGVGWSCWEWFGINNTESDKL
jgi:hypothetical protein